MKILFIRENRDIEIKNVTVKNNQFNINNMLYVIDNPHYFYIKSKLFGITYIIGHCKVVISCNGIK